MPATEGKTEGSTAVTSKLSCQYEMCSEKMFNVDVAIKRVKRDLMISVRPLQTKPDKTP